METPAPITQDLREKPACFFNTLNGNEIVEFKKSDFTALCDAIDSIHGRVCDELDECAESRSRIRSEMLRVNRERDSMAAEIDRLQGECDHDGWMELPKDADGVPIHVGDEVCGYGCPDGGVVVKSLNGSMIIVGRPDGAENYAKNGLLWAADSVRHYHAPTVEDVLREFANVGIRIAAKHGIVAGEINFYADEEAIAKFAAKLREVMPDER